MLLVEEKILREYIDVANSLNVLQTIVDAFDVMTRELLTFAVIAIIIINEFII